MMLKLYPDRRWPALVRVLSDTASFVWTVAWAYLGWLIYSTVMGLEVIADGITNTGLTFNQWIAAFRKAVPGGIPILTKFLQDTADTLQHYSGNQLVAAGHNIHDAILKTAITLALLVALPPILLVLVPYLSWRWRDIRETGAALAFVRIAAVTGRADAARAVLAYRAVSTLSFRQLMRASADPVGDLVEHRYERLASAMLRRAGLDPKRLPPPKAIRTHGIAQPYMFSCAPHRRAPDRATAAPTTNRRWQCGAAAKEAHARSPRAQKAAPATEARWPDQTRAAPPPPAPRQAPPR